jgi:NAD+ kinase
MHILIVRNNSNSQAIEASLLLATYLNTQGVSYTIADSSELAGADPTAELVDVVEDGIDLGIALGGDGTLLRTARQIGYRGVPILGINYGTLGFLTNVAENGVLEPLSAALSGECQEDPRTNLEIITVCEGEADPFTDDCGAAGAAAAGAAAGDGQRPCKHYFAMNEVAVTRGANGRIIEFDLGVSGSVLADMRGDGLVVASATGSTAYALSAGGPLVAPGFTGLVAVPIAPHTLHSRAIVTGPSDVVEMNLDRNTEGRDPTLFVDGEPVELETPLKRLYVRRGETPTMLLHYKDEGFYPRAAKVFF